STVQDSTGNLLHDSMTAPAHTRNARAGKKKDASHVLFSEPSRVEVFGELSCCHPAEKCLCSETVKDDSRHLSSAVMLSSSLSGGNSEGERGEDGGRVPAAVSRRSRARAGTPGNRRRGVVATGDLEGAGEAARRYGPRDITGNAYGKLTALERESVNERG